MGIDRPGKQHRRSKHRTHSKSPNPYVKILVKLYKFLARRTNSTFNKVILRRLFLSKSNRPPMGLGRIVNHMRGKNDKQIAVIVGNVVDDERCLDIPKLKVCALRFSETARARIVKSGGECITFDRLAILRPEGSNAILLRGSRNARATVKHFGAPGVPGSHSKPYVRSKGRKFEQARGRRASRGFKV